ncbi:MAG: response regulator [Syntrophobacteraceae bacterium]
MSGTVLKFLIVDDEPDMCWALHHILEKKGFAAVVALTAQEALAQMASNGFRMAFLDAKLPDMEGLELARRIRLMDPDVRIVMISGYFYKDDVSVQRALDGGLISGFISKPFQNDEILGIIEILNPSIP